MIKGMVARTHMGLERKIRINKSSSVLLAIYVLDSTFSGLGVRMRKKGEKDIHPSDDSASI